MIKVGLLIKDFDALENWELRIIEYLKNNPNLELTLLIKDKLSNSGTQIEKKTLSQFLFSKQVELEKKRYLKNNQSVNKEEIIEYLSTIPTIHVNPKKERELDIFNIEDSQKIKEFNLDVILKHGFNFISGKILNSAKHGIWMLSHSDISLKKGGLPGFWEVLNKEPVIGVSLLQLSLHLDRGNIIDKAFYNPNYRSFIVTNSIVKESSVSLLFKNLRKLLQDDRPMSKGEIKIASWYKIPNLFYSSKYLFNFYNSYITGKLRNLIPGKELRKQNWTIFLGKGNFMESDISKLKPVKVPKDEFWADPFLFNYLDELYVFFEVFSYKTNRGKISCGRVKNNQLVDIIDVLNFDYHLSYPFIFEEDGEIFMIPETGENLRLEIYKCVNFPDKWELYSTAFDGESVQDTTLYIDEQKQKWLFLNKVIDPNADRTSELYIYKVDSLKLNTFVPHKQNPVIIDSRVARNGGAIFRHDDKIYRPSQSNTDGVYGKALNINQIKILSIDEYSEETIRKIEPDFQKDLVSIHHLHQIDGMFVFDGAFNMS